MNSEFPLPAIYASLTLALAYFASLWWLLKGERRLTVVSLIVLAGCALFLRVYRIMDLPPGLNDDELQTFHHAYNLFETRKIFSPGIQHPILHIVLFKAPLITYLSSVFWSIRLSSIIFGSLSVVVAFAIGRGMRFGVMSSFVISALVATLPWSIFWGRVTWGGEIVFSQTLLLAALARILWSNGGKGDVAIGALGLIGLLWEYFGAWSMLGMPMLAMCLVTSRRQFILCFSILVLGIVAWLPWLLNVQAWSGFLAIKSSNKVSSVWSVFPIALDLTINTYRSLRAFIFPEGDIHWISLYSIANHPLIVLGGALAGLYLMPRRTALFVGLGFLGGIVPTILAFNGRPSTHRMICAYIFVSLACAGAVEYLATCSRLAHRKMLVRCGVVVFVVVAAWRSTAIFLSPQFWLDAPPIFMHAETAISESIALPVTSPFIVEPQVGRYLMARQVENPGFLWLTYDSWMPNGDGEYAFASSFPELIGFYRNALPADQVAIFGESSSRLGIRARFTASDARRWQQYGWTVERRCSNPQQPLRIPAFIFQDPMNWGTECLDPREIIFTAVWNRPVTKLTLHGFRGVPMRIQTSQGSDLVIEPSDITATEFTLHPGEKITITITAIHGTIARLFEGDQTSTVFPSLESFKPAS